MRCWDDLLYPPIHPLMPTLGKGVLRRQKPIGVFVVDFYSSTESLIVQLDGPIHAAQQKADRERQEILESLGHRFVRISSETVECNLPLAPATIRVSFKNP